MSYTIGSDVRQICAPMSSYQLMIKCEYYIDVICEAFVHVPGSNRISGVLDAQGQLAGEELVSDERKPTRDRVRGQDRVKRKITDMQQT